MTDDELTSRDEKLVRVQYLGRFVSPSNNVRFKELLRHSVRSGIIDITGWSVEAVRVLLITCKEEGLSITLKNGDRYTTPVRFPDGLMFDVLVQTVMTK